MHLRRLWLTDFRGYETAEVTFDDGLTAVLGPNGHGKSNLLEAIGYLATLGSFRGAPNEALVRVGADRAIVRAEGEREGRALLLEAEIVRNGRNRAQINRQPLRRARDLLGALRVTVFSPDDLVLVKGSPGDRRVYLDDTLVALHPRYDQARTDLDKVLRQRGALLKQAGGRLTDEVELTLDVFDAKLTAAGEYLAGARRKLTEELGPVLEQAYRDLARTEASVTATYDPPWMATGLADALAASRRDDLRRGVSTVGPAPRRARPGPRRDAGPDPRLAGGAAVAGPGPAARVARGRDPAHRDPAGAAARRRVLRARRGSQRRPAGLVARRADGAQHGDRSAGGRRARPGDPGARRGGHRGRRSRRWLTGAMPWSPLPTPDGDGGPPPGKLGDVLDSVLQGLGGPGVDAIVLVHERWADLVGPEVAAVSLPSGIRDGRLSVTVDGPAWADHLRWSEAEILARIEGLVGVGKVTSLTVHVGRRRRP